MGDSDSDDAQEYKGGPAQGIADTTTSFEGDKKDPEPESECTGDQKPGGLFDRPESAESVPYIDNKKRYKESFPGVQCLDAKPEGLFDKEEEQVEAQVKTEPVYKKRWADQEDIVEGNNRKGEGTDDAAMQDEDLRGGHAGLVRGRRAGAQTRSGERRRQSHGVGSERCGGAQVHAGAGDEGGRACYGGRVGEHGEQAEEAAGVQG